MRRASISKAPLLSGSEQRRESPTVREYLSKGGCGRVTRMGRGSQRAGLGWVRGWVQVPEFVPKANRHLDCGLESGHDKGERMVKRASNSVSQKS